MAEIWESPEIQKIGQAWAEAKLSGASQSVLDALHEAAENLRAQQGYTGGSDGSKTQALKQKVEQVTQQVTQAPVQTIITDTGESSLDDPEREYQTGFPVYDFGSTGATSTGDTGTGTKIIGFSVLFLVGVAILDRLVK